MKRYWSALFLGSCLLLAHSPQSAQSPPRPFVISLPLNVAPESASIETGIYGRGLVMRAVRTRAGVHEYPIDVTNTDVGPARSLKLLIYIPGYRMVAWEFNEAEAHSGKVFIPPLIPLATMALTGRVVDADQRPLAGQTLHLDYFLQEVMPYFGYIDGSVPSLSIGDVRTNARGEFTINLPALVDDPFFGSGRFQLSSDGRSFLGSAHLNPNNFTAKKAYEPLIITNIGRGTLSGILGKEFLKRNGLSEDLSIYVAQGDTIVTAIKLQARRGSMIYNAYLQTDGSFQVELPTGEYDLMLSAPELGEPIIIHRGHVIEKDKRRVVKIP